MTGHVSHLRNGTSYCNMAAYSSNEDTDRLGHYLHSSLAKYIGSSIYGNLGNVDYKVVNPTSMYYIGCHTNHS